MHLNVMVDAVIREWLRQVLGTKAAKHGYGDSVAIFLAIFYADDAVIAARDPVLLQKVLDNLVGLIERVRLRTNTLKTKVMTCLPGKIQTRHSTATYNHSRVGLSTGDE